MLYHGCVEEYERKQKNHLRKKLMKNSHPSQTGLPRDRFPQKLQLGYRLNNIYLKTNKQTKKDVDY